LAKGVDAATKGRSPHGFVGFSSRKKSCRWNKSAESLTQSEFESDWVLKTHTFVQRLGRKSGGFFVAINNCPKKMLLSQRGICFSHLPVGVVPLVQSYSGCHCKLNEVLENLILQSKVFPDFSDNRNSCV